MNRLVYLGAICISSILFAEKEETLTDDNGSNPVTYTEYLDELLSELPKTHVKDSSDNAVASGKVLPEEARLITDLTGDNRVQFGENEHEKNLTNRLQYITLAEFGNKNKSPEVFLNSLLPYKDRLPPARADLIIYRASWVNFNEISMNTHGASIDLWQQFANAKNPIYRMLAIKGAVSSIPEKYRSFHSKNGPADPRLRYWLASGRISFLKQFLSEEDPIILRNLYSAFYQTVHPDLLDILEYQQKREVVLANEELLSHLKWVNGVIEKEVSSPYYQEVMQDIPELVKAPKKQAVLELTIYAYPDGKSLIRMSSITNPNGSRNLEYDKTKDITRKYAKR